MSTSSKGVASRPETAPPIELELLLGLGPDDATLAVAPDARTLDLHPWLLDCVAVQVNCLGHHDEMPRAWDWENVLTLLDPGEELLYVLDHVRSDGSQTGRPFTLWLAIRFPQQRELSTSDLDRRRKRARMIVSQFQRQAFPGTELRWVDPNELQNLLGFSAGSQKRCVCVSGLPSPREITDDEREVERANATRNYQSLNDVAESLFDLRCDYRIAFVIERVASESLRRQLGQATQLRDAIHPHVRRTTQAGGSDGVNRSTQSSEARGTNNSTASAEGTQSGWSGGGGVGVPLGPVLIGVQASYNRSKTQSTTNTSGRTWTRTDGASTGESKEENWSMSDERVRSMLELADSSLERTIAALHEAHGTGGYRWSAFVLADGKNADLISGALVGVLAGARTKDYPFNRFAVTGAGSELLQGNDSLLELVAEAAPIVSLTRACEALLLPEAELPGVRLRRNVFFGRTVSPPDDGGQRIRLGPDAFSALSGHDQPELIEIPRKDLFRHILVAGATGSGKTTRVVEILNQLEDDQLSVVVLETAKRTYRKRFQRRGRPAPLVYSLGSSREYPGSRFQPLRINPFFFEKGTSLKRHVAVLSDALAELMPTEAMIGPLMRRAVEATYFERGWDIELGAPLDAGEASWPTVLDFAAQVRQIASALNYGPEVTANYRGALENRASLFLDATFQDIFGHGGNRSIDELFPGDMDAMIEVEDLPPSEVDIRAFVMTLLLSRLRAVQGLQHALQSNGDLRRWLVVIEEAHNVLDRSFEVRRPADESNAGRTLLRCIDRLLQEGREIDLGLMVIDQSPVSLARSVISNTGTKIVMRLEDGKEMEEIGHALGLDEDGWKKLGYLQEGEAIIKASFMDAPVKTARFAYTTAGPSDGTPQTAGMSPSYATLERLWRPVLDGARTPDDVWLHEALAAAVGSAHLVGFVGAKALLEARRNERDALSRTHGLREAIAEVHLDGARLLVAARKAFADGVVFANYGPLTIVARLMFRALLRPTHPDPKRTMVGAGLHRAADLLALAGIGDATKWRTLLLGIAGIPGHPWRDACARFHDYCHIVGRTDTTAPVRALVLLLAEASRGALRIPASDRVVEPIDLIMQAQALLQPIVETEDSDSRDEEWLRRRRILVDHFTREVVFDLAARCDESIARAVRELLTSEKMTHA